MDDNLSGEEEDYYYSSDQESLNGIDNDESVSIPVSSRSNTVKVITKESLLAAQVSERAMTLLLIHIYCGVSILKAKLFLNQCRGRICGE
jgi:ariadne-1